ncbi:MAG: fluoride efflux transporter CrcB [bacterium]|nr:fluoride efflux transporter CrcB [bacterium]
MPPVHSIDSIHALFSPLTTLTFLEILALGGGGMLGTVLRYWLAASALRTAGPDFPYGILAANLLGSFGIAFAVAALATLFQNQPAWRLFLIVGFFGSFTTFSTFSLDLLIFFQRGAVGVGIGYCLASVLGGVLLAWGGWNLGLLFRSAAV